MPFGLSAGDQRVWKRWRDVRNTSADYGATTFDEFKRDEQQDWQGNPVHSFADGINDDIQGHWKREKRDFSEGNLVGVFEDLPLADDVSSFFKSIF